MTKKNCNKVIAVAQNMPTSDHVTILQWRQKKSVHEFFPEKRAPNAELIRKEALLYLGTGSKLQSTCGAVNYLLSNREFWLLLILCLASVIGYIIFVLMKAPPPYLAIVNTLQCAWYVGSNLSSANYRVIPYGLPPRPVAPTDVGPLAEAAKELLGRWRRIETLNTLEECILAHRSSDCRFEGGIHMCSVRASPRFCSHYHTARLTQLHQVRSILPPTVTPDPGAVHLPEAKPLGEMKSEPGVSEDCLFLGIGRPRDYKTGYPIIVFITGSGYVSETTRSLGQDSPLHWVDDLPDRLQAVVVRIGYRLGFHGKFRRRVKDKSKPENVQFNLGLEDLVMGLQYLKQVAESFGGDAKRVTLVGHGSGAALVMALLRYQRATSNKLAKAAWISSGPSRIPESGPEMDKALDKIHANRWTDKAELRLQCAQDDVAACRLEMERMDEGQLLAYLTANEDPYKAWAQSGLLLDWGPNVVQLTMRKGQTPPPPPLEWLTPDVESGYLTGSPTEGSGGLSSWDDIPVVFANVAEHYAGFPGFRASDAWKENWQKILKAVQNMGYAGSPDKLIAQLQRPDMSLGDSQGLLTAARVGSLLRFICPYRYLAKRLAGEPKRKSSVYHYVQQYSLRYPAKFLSIGNNRKLTGAFYGLDLLLMLGTAPTVAESWDRRDQAAMQHLQNALSAFASSGGTPPGWWAINSAGKYTQVMDTAGRFKSVPADDALSYCDTIPYSKYPELRTIV